DAQVGVQGSKLRDERFRGELLRLQHRQARCYSIPFYGTFLYLQSAACRFVRHGNDSHDAISSLHQRPHRRHGEIGRPHIHDAQCFRFDGHSCTLCRSCLKSPRVCPIRSSLVFRYLSLYLVGSVTMGTTSSMESPYPSSPARLVGLLVIRRILVMPSSCRMLAPTP